MLSTLLSKYRAFAVVAGIVVLIEMLVYVLPVEYGLPAGSFMSNHRRQLMESDRPCFDYIMFGDSRSLSIIGHAPSATDPYSFYNFSLPAMEPRYFAQYLRKYLQERDCVPSAVLFAGSPSMFEADLAHPLHDPDRIYSQELDEELYDYLARRVAVRLERPFQQPEVDRQRLNELIWEAFSHRYLHTFSIGELAQIYTGPERVFVIREAIPLLYRTYKFREAIETFTLDFSIYHFADPELPEACQECNALESQAMCHPRLTDVQDNRQTSRILLDNYGGINLADRFKPARRAEYEQIKDEFIERDRSRLNDSDRRIRMEPLVRLIQEARSHSIDVIIVVPPPIDVLYDTYVVGEYLRNVKKIAEAPDVHFIAFPEPAYPRDLYIEQVHYSCAGARKLNRDFRDSVMPQVLEASPPVDLPLAIKGFSR